MLHALIVDAQLVFHRHLNRLLACAVFLQELMVPFDKERFRGHNMHIIRLTPQPDFP